MYKILRKEKLSKEVFRFTIEAPMIARERKAGQFADVDSARGTIDIVFQAVGEGTHRLAMMKEGDMIGNVLGPLGRPTHIERYGRCVCVGGGIGVAPLYPIAKALKEAGNEVRIIIGARNESLLIEEDEMRALDPELVVVTDDGSRGRKAVVTEPLREMCGSWKPDLVVTIGPSVMMKYCALTTKEYGIRTLASLNTIMIDGTGMCGGCRVSVGGETRFVCVDGPEFDAHEVDWDNMMMRQRTYSEYEREAHHRCHLESGIAEGEA